MLQNCKIYKEKSQVKKRVNVTSLPNESDNNSNADNKGNVNIPTSTSTSRQQKAISVINKEDDIGEIVCKKIQQINKHVIIKKFEAMEANLNFQSMIFDDLKMLKKLKVS